MTKMTMQPAFVAITGVVLRPAKSVVEQKREAVLQRPGYVGYPARRRQCNFRDVVIWQLGSDVMLDRPDGIDQDSGGCLVNEYKLVQFIGHTQLSNGTVSDQKALYRQRVQNFVGDDYAAMRVGHAIQPDDLISKFGYFLAEQSLLPLAQVGGYFDDSILGRQRVEFRQRPQHVHGELAAARSEFEDRAVNDMVENVRTLPRKNPAEQRRDFRGRHKIPVRAEFPCAGAVVTQTGRIQRVVHELGEADTAAGIPDALANIRRALRAVFRTWCVGLWQCETVLVLHVVVEVFQNGTVMMTEPTLNDKVALVTGAARRVGAAIASCLHAAGANVAIHYRGSATEADSLAARLNAARDNSAITIQADLLDTGVAPRLIASVLEWRGRLDILVNNASAFYATPLGEITEQHWDDLVGSNLKAPLFLSQAAAPALREANGVIVNIVDIHAQRPLRDHLVYGLAKAGLAMLTRSLAKDLAPDVRVNGVAPGAILWPESDMSESTKESIISQVPLSRGGGPGDIAGCVLYLVRDASYVTGQIIAVDGGRSIGW